MRISTEQIHPAENIPHRKQSDEFYVMQYTVRLRLNRFAIRLRILLTGVK